MAVGLAASIAAELLDALFNSDAYDGPTNIYAKLHVGDPGAAGTGNPAGNTTRQEVTFAAASGGTIANDARRRLDEREHERGLHVHLPVGQTSSAGNFLGSGAVVSNSVTIGDTYTIAIGDLDVVISPVAA